MDIVAIFMVHLETGRYTWVEATPVDLCDVCGTLLKEHPIHRPTADFAVKCNYCGKVEHAACREGVTGRLCAACREGDD